MPRDGVCRDGVIKITYQGVTKKCSDWAKEYICASVGVDQYIMRYRLNKLGWKNIKRVLTEPPKYKHVEKDLSCPRYNRKNKSELKPFDIYDGVPDHIKDILDNGSVEDLLKAEVYNTSNE